ncbi:MAG: PDZ domain-containing protein, partial [Planctomycetota bacterium]
HSRDFRTWKRYRGGMATDIWLFNLDTYESRRATDWEGTDTMPMWHGDHLYYLSDGGPAHRLNIWKYNLRTGDRTQVTEFEDFDVKFPSMGPGQRGRGEIVFQNGPSLYLLDLRTEKHKSVDVVIPGDRPSLRKRRVDFSDFMAGGHIAPGGERVVIEARGDIWSVPAEKGITRNLSRTSGVAERDPLWSPDGRWIAYLSDETGEYELYVTQSDGKGETKQLTDNGDAYRYMLSWSPDSEKILFGEKSGAMYLVDVETQEQTHVATDPWAQMPSPSWSHDSKWLTFSLADNDNSMGVVHVYSVETGELTPLTSNMFDSTEPTFDRKGEYLFFASNRRFSPEYSSIDTTYIYNNSEVLLAVPLNADVEVPWKLESDEVEWEEEEADDEDAEDGAEDGDAEASEDADEDASEEEDAEETDAEAGDDPFAGFDTEHPLWGIWEGEVSGLGAMAAMMGTEMEDSQPYKLTFIVREDGGIITKSEFMGESDEDEDATFDIATNTFRSESSENGMTSIAEATLNGDTLSGTWEIKELGMGGTWSVTRTDEEITPEMLGDIEGDSGEAKPVVIDFEGFEARARQLSVSPGSFGQLSVNDKNHLLYVRSGDGMPALKLYDISDDDPSEKNVLAGVFGYMLSADGKKIGVMGPAGMAVVNAASGQSFSKQIPTDMMMAKIDPREEWRQIFVDAWRIQRDFFYDEGLHGVDWEGVRDRYIEMIDDCVTRDDVSFVIREMISELNVGHAYYWGGDTEGAPSVNVGLLGVDYELDETDEGTAYRIAHIFEGAAWDVDARNPLRDPAVNVKEGEYLLAVNGMELDTDEDPWAAFVGLAGEITELTVSEKPFMDDDARTVLVKPLWGEGNLRYRAWIEMNRNYVDYKTGGKVGYIYVPNTGVNGQNDLYRQFFGQRHKDGLIIDERWNGGGQIPTRFIELLNRPITNYWARRDGNDWPWPPDSHQGSKVMLINGLAGSGGDMFPALVRQNGLGKLIGTRTWGGLVGISGNPSLID